MRLVPLALIVGGMWAGVALALLDLIGLFAHLAYHGRVGLSLVPPSLHRFGVVTAVIPVARGAIVGLMARYGSERIRGHGIPEAMETILIGATSPMRSAVSRAASRSRPSSSPIHPGRRS